MKYWTGLHNSAYQDMLRVGADNLVTTALAARSANSSRSNLIRGNAHNPSGNEDQNRESDGNA
jgi:protoheme ferro-lyase